MTGTFDDWGKTVRLDKKGDLYEKLVHLPETAKNIYYKVGKRTVRPAMLWPYHPSCEDLKRDPSFPFPSPHRNDLLYAGLSCLA